MASAALDRLAELIEWRWEDRSGYQLGDGRHIPSRAARGRWAGRTLVDHPENDAAGRLELQPGGAIDHPLYWERGRWFAIGPVEDLPGGVIAPLAVTRRSDRIAVAVAGAGARPRYGPRWPLEQYASAARCLGRFNGAYLAGRPIPDYPWLCGPDHARHARSFRRLARDYR